MNWLEKHVTEFVIPGIRTLARRDGLEVHDRDIKPWSGTVRPNSKCRFKEAGMIHAVASSVLPKGNTTREIALGLCRKVGEPGDAEFVYELDTQSRVRDLGKHYPGVNGADVLHSFLGATTRAIKAHLRHPKSRVIYPGRDVWAFEVMSQRMGVPSVYDPRISREIDEHEKAFKDVVDAWDIPSWGHALAFDSGYAGTVPRAIGRVAGVHEINIVMLSAVDVSFQIFPGHTGSRAKALALEYLAKYRKRCLVKDGIPTQPLAQLEEFIKAALLTVWIWHHVSPRRLPSWDNNPHVRKAKQIRRINKDYFGRINIVGGTGANTTMTIDPNSWATAGIATNTPIGGTLTPITVFATSTAGGTGLTTVDVDPFGAFTFNSSGAAVTGGLF